jgi:hypothetical protein
MVAAEQRREFAEQLKAVLTAQQMTVSHEGSDGDSFRLQFTNQGDEGEVSVYSGADDALWVRYCLDRGAPVLPGSGAAAPAWAGDFLNTVHAALPEGYSATEVDKEGKPRARQRSNTRRVIRDQPRQRELRRPQ